MYHFQKASEVLRVQYTIPKVAAMVIQEAAEKSAAKYAQHEEGLEAIREKQRPSKAKETVDGNLIFDKTKLYELPEGITADMLQTQKGVVVGGTSGLLDRALPSNFDANQIERAKAAAREAEYAMKFQLQQAEGVDAVEAQERKEMLDDGEEVDAEGMDVDENGEPMLSAPPTVSPTAAAPAWEEQLIQTQGLDARGYPATTDGNAVSGIPTVVLPTSMLPQGMPSASALPENSIPVNPCSRGGMFEATPTSLAAAKNTLNVPKVPAAFSFETFCKELHQANAKTQDQGLLSPQKMNSLLAANKKDLEKMPDAFWVTLMRQASVNVLEREASRSPGRRDFYSKVHGATVERTKVSKMAARQQQLRRAKAMKAARHKRLSARK